MHLTCLDLEGVLLPEVWIATAELTGIPELKRTTRDEPDYDKLMRYRLDILDKHDIRIHDIQKAINTLEPLPGALEFTQWLIARSRLVILSDTFAQFAAPLMAKLGHPTLFCHELVIDENSGKILDYKLRQQDQKRKAVEAFQGLNFEVIAGGDSYNDLSMIEAADHGILFRPPDSLREERPQFPVATDHTSFRSILEAVFQKCENTPVGNAASS